MIKEKNATALLPWRNNKINTKELEKNGNKREGNKLNEEQIRRKGKVKRINDDDKQNQQAIIEENIDKFQFYKNIKNKTHLQLPPPPLWENIYKSHTQSNQNMETFKLVIYLYY